MIFFWFCLFTVILMAAIKIAHTNGVTKGRNEGAVARQRYLEAMIDGAKKGVTKMSFDAFAEHCHTTVTSELYGTPDWFAHICFKKAGETGELMEHIGKASRDDRWSIVMDGAKGLPAARKQAIIKEIGDGWWYDVMILAEIGSCPQEVILANIEKRESRKARGTLKGSGDER